MAEINLTGKHHGFGHTNRKDAWWVRPLLFLSVSLLLSSIQPGLHSRESIIHSDLIFRHFIRPNFLVIHPIAGLVQSPAGGRNYPGRLHSWYYGLPAYFG